MMNNTGLGRSILRNLILCASILMVACSDKGQAAKASIPEENIVEDAVASEGHEHEGGQEACYICDPSLREAGRLWCKEHGRYEDRCWVCHPDLEDKERLFCEEHSLYEDECSLCHPGLLENPDASDQEEHAHAAGDLDAAVLFCNEHRVPEELCGICQPQLALELVPGEELQVRFESTQSASKAGIDTTPAQATSAQAGLSALCEVMYDGNQLARITPLAEGILRKVLVDVGSEVEEGDLLAEVHSTEVASAKAAFVAAAVDFELKEAACKRETRLAAKNISSDRELQEADAACRTSELELRTSRQRLLNFGFREQDVESIAKEQDSSATLFVRAPYSGTIVERSAVAGEVVAPGKRLLTLANLNQMWLSLSLPADKGPLLREGLLVSAHFDDYPQAQFSGELTWVNTAIDGRTRMLRARAVIDNPARRLKAGMFGKSSVLLGVPTGALSIPADAVQRYEQAPYVFVRLAADLFALRRVALMEGTNSDGFATVVSGLKAGDPVVTEGAFTVMSEFLKSRLGAGCVDD